MLMKRQDEEDISLQDIHEVMETVRSLRITRPHRRGPCCLIHAMVGNGRNFHVVVTTEKIPARVITVYEPRQPYWITPGERRRER